MVICTKEPAFTREATEIMVKIVYSTYSKVDLDQVTANAGQMNYDERINLLSLRK